MALGPNPSLFCSLPFPVAANPPSFILPEVKRRVAQLVNGEPMFLLLNQRKTALMIQADLKDAGVPYEDSEGRFADFHALRHSFITGLWESGASPDVVMALARHKSLQMTMRYTHVDRNEQTQAIRSMRSPLDGADQ